MNRRNYRALALTATVALIGCVPEKKIVWSPDGQHAAVIGADGLYRCDAKGALSPRLAENVNHAAWFPNNASLAISTTRSAKTWDEVAPVLSDAEKRELIAAAEQVRTAALAYSGDWDKFEPEAFKHFTGQQLGAGLLYIRDKRSEGMAEKLGDKWNEVKTADVTVTTLQVIDATLDGASPAKVLACGLAGIRSISVSPDGKAVAYVEEMPGENSGGRLMVVSAEPAAGAPLLVAERVGRSISWSPDGAWLAFIRASVPLPSDGSFALRLGSVSRRRVRGEEGKLLAPSSQATGTKRGGAHAPKDHDDAESKGGTAELAPIDDLAGIVDVDELGIQWLRDGRIVFAAMDVRLPCTAKDMPTRLGLFALDLERQATVTRLLPREAETQVGDAVNYFEVSPDGRRVVIPGKNGTVSVLVLATGEVTQVQAEKDSEDKLRTLPTWRTADELCLAVPTGATSGAGRRAEIALWSTKGTRAISKAWPESAVTGILTAEKKEGAPASHAASQPAK